MGSGWRRAFCTTVLREPENEQQRKSRKSHSTTTSPTLGRRGLGFFSTASNPSTPRLRCRTGAASDKPKAGSNPASPRSPLKLSLFKNSFKFRQSSGCGVCESSVKTGQGTAIYTAECGHAFHFPCIAAHVRRHAALVCPVCSAAWSDVPLLAAHKLAAQAEAREEKNDDDEPLLSAAPAQENSEEFQGFSVIPDPSSDSVLVRLLPEAAVVSVSNSHQTYAVVLRVKARGTASHRRAPVDLVAVLDAGATMIGAKLQMMKRAMRLVVSSLGPADRLSVVAFSAAPRRLLPLSRMTAQGQIAARRVVDGLVSGNGSSAGEALSKAARVLEERRERNPVASIILLSDSVTPSTQRNSGSSTRFAHIEIPVHAEPAEDAFAKCVSGFLSVVVQDLRIQLGFPAGDAEIAAVYSSVGRPTALGSGSIRIGDLYAEEERELLVELRVRTPAAGSHRAMSVRCLYKDPATKEIVYGREQAVVVPPPTAVRSSAQKIERLRNVFIATRAVAESRRIVECGGELASAQQLVASARALVMQSSLGSAEECTRALEAELAELQWRRQSENGEPLTPTSAWRAAEHLAKLAVTKKSLNRVSDLHGFENARF